MYLFLLATLASCQSCSYKDVDDIVVEGVETPVLLGDPFIMLHDGTYCAYGTPMRMKASKSIPPMI